MPTLILYTSLSVANFGSLPRLGNHVFCGIISGCAEVDLGEKEARCHVAEELPKRGLTVPMDGLPAVADLGTEIARLTEGV